MARREIPEEKPYLKESKHPILYEWLATYAWAILVVLAAIGALWYFGVLSPSNFFPKHSNETTSCCDQFCKQVSNGEFTCGSESIVGMNGKIICKAAVKGSTASALYTFNVPNKSEFCP